VAAHLVSDVPVATFLSARSRLLRGHREHGPRGKYAARVHRPILGFGSDSADETGLARTLASRYGAELTVVDIRPDLVNIFEPIIRALDEPHADDSAIPTWLLSQSRGESLQVALSA